MSTSVACPKSYENAIAGYTARYRGFLGLTRARSLWSITDGTVANYNNGTFTLQSVADVKAGLPGTTFQFYVNPTPAPSLPIIGINLTGLANAAAIGAAIFAAVNTAAVGFSVLTPGPTTASLIFMQNAPGSLGNTQIDTSIWSGLINGFGIEDSTVFFYGGQSLGIPLLWGPQRGMGPTTSDTVQGVESE
jgi:hypothetical protein